MNMKAALELGRGVFLAPIGYLNAPRSTWGLTNRRERPLAFSGNHIQPT